MGIVLPSATWRGKDSGRDISNVRRRLRIAESWYFSHSDSDRPRIDRQSGETEYREEFDWRFGLKCGIFDCTACWWCVCRWSFNTTWQETSMTGSKWLRCETRTPISISIQSRWNQRLMMWLLRWCIPVRPVYDIDLVRIIPVILVNDELDAYGRRLYI